MLRPCEFARHVSSRAVFTPKALHSSAQGRAAHPGSEMRHPYIPRRGFTTRCPATVYDCSTPLGYRCHSPCEPRVRCATLGWGIQPLRGRREALRAYRRVTELHYLSVPNLPSALSNANVRVGVSDSFERLRHLAASPTRQFSVDEALVFGFFDRPPLPPFQEPAPPAGENRRCGCLRFRKTLPPRRRFLPETSRRRPL